MKEVCAEDYHKKGLGAIVAVVLILLITIPLIVLLGSSLAPFINNLLLVDMSSVDLEVVTKDGFTVYDAQDDLMAVHIRRGQDDIDF